nr:hypothetical protein [Tanacetum cinerariifolium]
MDRHTRVVILAWQKQDGINATRLKAIFLAEPKKEVTLGMTYKRNSKPRLRFTSIMMCESMMSICALVELGGETQVFEPCYVLGTCSLIRRDTTNDTEIEYAIANSVQTRAGKY